MDSPAIEAWIEVSEMFLLKCFSASDHGMWCVHPSEGAVIDEYAIIYPSIWLHVSLTSIIDAANTDRQLHSLFDVYVQVLRASV